MRTQAYFDGIEACVWLFEPRGLSQPSFSAQLFAHETLPLHQQQLMQKRRKKLLKILCC